MNKLIDSYLNISKCYMYQRKTDISALQDKVWLELFNESIGSNMLQAIQIYPDLPLEFRRCWPLHDHIRLRLKYTSGRERRRREKAIINRVLQRRCDRESSEEEE